MTDDYFSHTANKGRPRKEVVTLDVIEFHPVELPAAIEVHEHTEGTGEFRRLFAELLERRA
jgi:hypothetical protein